MIELKLRKFIASRRCTLLGVGPMSVTTVDSVIELANENNIPLILIASRRQIEAEELGGGYVNGWHTTTFADYVRKKDTKGLVILARDHGGPWQNYLEAEKKLSLAEAMASAKRSYLIDIESGFDCIHIDPSVDIHCNPDIDEVLFRVFELYDFCWSVARKKHRNILFEVGTEEQTEGNSSLEAFEYSIAKIYDFCRKNNFPLPMFVVGQTGTKVAEMRNIGTFDSPFRVRDEIPSEIQIPRILDLCNKYNVCLKEHNADYLSDAALAWHRKLGIHSVNVAPEFGVIETRALFSTLKEHGLEKIHAQMAEIAYQSKKWEKWMLPDTTANDYDRAVISGHYVFAEAGFKHLKTEAETILEKKGVKLNVILRNAVKSAIMRYIRNFGL